MKRFGPIAGMALLLAIAAAGAGPTNAPLRQIGPNVFELGAVQFDKSQKTLRFPTQLNMKEGLIEYLLVSGQGKTYESLLKTDANPYDIQLALLFLGAKGAPQTPALLAMPNEPFHVNHPGQPALSIMGDPISIELSWEAGGRKNHARAEDWIVNLSTKTNVARGSWTFNGSRVVNGVFLAQRDGQIVAMIDDIDAMVNNPRQGHDNDQIWQINSNALPPLNTTVEVTFKLEARTQ
ncbi:MAG TPA: YdjY domain-containing protein [Verrucomicrobiae bacterium]|jgi:hypothetical protein|nr:YdjY domain-containing protein [Verrucomicrobiae bacterium]